MGKLFNYFSGLLIGLFIWSGSALFTSVLPETLRPEYILDKLADRRGSDMIISVSRQTSTDSDKLLDDAISSISSDEFESKFMNFLLLKPAVQYYYSEINSSTIDYYTSGGYPSYWKLLFVEYFNETLARDKYRVSNNGWESFLRASKMYELRVTSALPYYQFVGSTAKFAGMTVVPFVLGLILFSLVCALCKPRNRLWIGFFICCALFILEYRSHSIIFQAYKMYITVFNHEEMINESYNISIHNGIGLRFLTLYFPTFLMILWRGEGDSENGGNDDKNVELEGDTEADILASDLHNPDIEWKEISEWPDSGNASGRQV